MKQSKLRASFRWNVYSPLIATALAVGGVFNMVSTVLAEGTAAGTQISNTATATYRDPAGTPQTSTSNTVVVEVAEIAGITVVNTAAQEFTPDGDPPGAGEQAEFIFEITNVGNDETDISLPAVADFSGPVDSVVSIIADLDGNGTYETPITSRTDIENVAPGESFNVQVVVEISSTAQNDDVITVTYGDTPGNGQNQPYDSSGGSVFTDDNDGADAATGLGAPVPGDPLTADTPSQTDAEAGPNGPANGEREASATGDITVGEEPLEQPLVELQKSIFDYADQGNTDPRDDTITYDLDFNILDQSAVPAGSDALAADLRSIAITVDGVQTRRILVSDAVPEGTSIQSVNEPAGWTAVYTTSDVATVSAVEADWSVTDPGNATRVGFISAVDEVITIGASVEDFRITVVADQVDPNETPITIANIAQVFGSGEADDPLTPEDESLSFPVMDESGDTTPSNYDPNNDTYSDFNPDVIDDPATPLPEGFTPNDGYIEDPSDLIDQGIDPGSDTPNDPADDNTGDPNDGDGEAIVVILVPEPVSDLLNGPDGAADAVGPTGTNDDFTNKSAPYSDGDPPVVPFTNTVDSSSTEDGWVRLEPIAPQDPTDLPNGTTATIIAPDGTRVEYVYDPNGNGGLGAWTKTNSGDPDIIVPVRADDGVPGGDDEFDYGVEVDLPNDPANINELDSFPVPIEATFAGVSQVSDPSDPANITAPMDDPNIDSPTNVTIDRIYTGFLELVKTAQVVRGDGPPVSGDPAPGNHIRYRVTYRNISETEVAPMQGNVLLTASDLAIVEDGTARACDYPTLTTANNWALDNDNGDDDNDLGTDLDTRHVVSSVELTNLDAGSTGSVLFYNGGEVCNGSNEPDFDPALATPSTENSGTTYNTDTTKYVFNITGDIEPSETGYVEFERRIN
ncbi:MAG: hypothetical protein AAGF01_03415 [Cyanobacteria bacterium P01_G01_bin.38]